MSRLFLSPPHVGQRERDLVAEAFDGNYIAPVGPMLDAFEREFAKMVGLPHAVALSSGTAAIHLALRGVGVGAGDTVVASSLTFIGGVAPILYQGATPVFIDSDAESWNMDPDLLADYLSKAKKAGKLPKAVLPTDIYGQSCDIDRIRHLCDDYGVALIIDAAESVGARYKGRHSGVGARAACYSFNGNKIMTTSGGGMLCSDNEKLIAEARSLSQQAREPGAHYEHTTYGYNYRMSNILAAIGRGQLEVLEERVKKRRAIFNAYEKRLSKLPGIRFMPEAPYGKGNRWLTVILVEPTAFGADRETIRLALEKENIESRPVWKPMHLQPVFKNTQTIGGKVSEGLFKDGLCLPSGTQMTDADIDRICGIIEASSK